MFKPTKNKLSIFFLILTFLPLIVMRLIVYPFTFQALKTEIIKNLEGAVRKQTELITKWMEERTADAHLIANNPFILHVVRSSRGNTAHTELLKYLGAKAVLITLGEQGMRLFEKGKKPFHIDTVAKEVFDVSGAGDTVIATLTLALAAGANIEEAAVISNFAAGIVVGKMGVATVAPEELLSNLI